MQGLGNAFNYGDRLLNKMRLACTPVYGGDIDHDSLLRFRKAVDAIKRTVIAKGTTVCSLYVSPSEIDLWVELDCPHLPLKQRKGEG